jgi:chromate transporter
LEVRPSLARVYLTFLSIGGTAYGGVWASARRIERAVVDQNTWLDRHEVRSLLVVSTVIPAPKFLAMAALVGHRARGLLGGLAATLGLVTPSATLILFAAVLIAPELLTGPLAPLAETIGIGVVGLLVGNALFQWRTGAGGRRNRLIGSAFALVMVGLIVLGVPLVPVAVGGFVFAPMLIRDVVPG